MEKIEQRESKRVQDRADQNQVFANKIEQDMPSFYCLFLKGT
jgi:hypothetical protein